MGVSYVAPPRTGGMMAPTCRCERSLVVDDSCLKCGKPLIVAAIIVRPDPVDELTRARRRAAQRRHREQRTEEQRERELAAQRVRKAAERKRRAA